MSLQRTPKKNSTAFWDARRGTIYSQKGGWVIGEAIHNHGFSMMDDLVGKKSYFQVLVLNATGRLPERRLADWLEAYFICLSWPDARIWCNQIGSLAGTARTTPVAAITAGVLASDSQIFGPGATKEGVDFITTALAKKKEGRTIDEIFRPYQRRPDMVPKITGYARPVASGDERVPAMERVREQLGFEIGEHLAFAFEIENVLAERFQEYMNIGGYRCAFLCDQGFSGTEIYRILSSAVLAGVSACYAEAMDSPADSFLTLRCDDMDYQGPPLREI
ncbi:MAG: hypothetical protein OEV91_02000 [Desulfobulbaceae bacterium]|nr:hypothetical protein [Desulfobulbaceae bacterium]